MTKKEFHAIFNLSAAYILRMVNHPLTGIILAALQWGIAIFLLKRYGSVDLARRQLNNKRIG